VTAWGTILAARVLCASSCHAVGRKYFVGRWQVTTSRGKACRTLKGQYDRMPERIRRQAQ
jgi:hypothetical protein